ncbi:long chain base biosynthesis protein 1-like [Olea europaea var. sylvestris]|uniref:long chain base biosynthesis protein 1-like n=1 Tax=Olea europaea var. sylvestris TaxID=158386 RepID=UPI000C1CD3E0|nr:long chain base biosynthesis protein 1-like [Olea europaea var. sylvestris]XP_022872217.1 long chain base biosynthesis protein 1-like [Olea europaea var. sylvestris]
MATLGLIFENSVKVALDWLKFALDASSVRAVVFGVPIGGHLFMEGLLLVVILFLLSQKSYRPPKRPLTEKVCFIHMEYKFSGLPCFCGFHT